MSTVDHPAHYGGDTPYEAIKVIEAWGLGFNLGNCVKYIARAGKKDPATEGEDLRKALWYLERHVASISEPAFVAEARPSVWLPCRCGKPRDDGDVGSGLCSECRAAS